MFTLLPYFCSTPIAALRKRGMELTLEPLLEADRRRRELLVEFVEDRHTRRDIEPGDIFVADAVEDLLNTNESTANDIIADIKSFSEERPLLLQSWRDEFGRFSRALFATSHHALCARLVRFGSCRANSSCIPYLSPSQGVPSSGYLQCDIKANEGSSADSALVASVVLFRIGNESYTL